MQREEKNPLTAYSKFLPAGVTLRRSQRPDKKWLYTLCRSSDRVTLAQRDESVVNKWKNPAKVFASIAKRTIVIQSRKTT